jgi:hypothetical protein
MAFRRLRRISGSHRDHRRIDDMGDVRVSSESPLGEPASAAPRHVLIPKWLVIVVGALLVLGVGFLLGWAATPDDGGSSSNAASRDTTPNRTVPSPPATSPSNRTLAHVGLRQSDLARGFSLQLIPGGNRVDAAPTLDLCNGNFASESLRRSRVQVVATDAQDDLALSTEAVLYSNGAATKQAFDELQHVASTCPDSPVASRVGEPTVTTDFNAPPDRSWPQVAGVDRLAYDFETTSSSGQSQHSIAVYLRRGRALLGLYFSDADTPPTAVAGQNTVQGIVEVFANRMAQLPDSLVGR